MHLIDTDLIIKKYETEILNTIDTSKVTILKGPTGCGKSTYVPFLLKDSKTIIIEPRRIAVKSLYNTLKCYIPNISYKIRFDKKICKNAMPVKRKTNDKNCKFEHKIVNEIHKNINKYSHTIVMTDGMFINELLSKNEIDYDYIIIDEVHERSIRTDIILGILKSRITEIKSKIILMGATINTKHLQNYFAASIVNIKGQNHIANIFYEEEPVSDYIIESYLKIKKIITENSTGNRDILVFLPGEEDINDLYKMVTKLPQTKPYKIFSSLSDKDQLRIFEPCSLIKVILATNICETSLTIPGIKYVIDCGLFKERIFNSVNLLGIKMIGRDSADQRLGRCNRTGEGVCYRVYTKECYNKMRMGLPEIKKADLSFVFLFMAGMAVNFCTFDFLTLPNKNNARHAIKFLLSIKSIAYKEEIGFTITEYGRRVLRNPMDVNLSHFYEICKSRKIERLGAVLVSLISQENYNFIDRNINENNKLVDRNISESKSKVENTIKNEVENNKNTWTNNKNDIRALLELFIKYIKEEDKYSYCKKHKVPEKGMEKSVLIYKQLIKSNEQDIDDSEENIGILEDCFTRAFKNNLSVRQNDGTYIMVDKNVNVYVHPSSYFFKKRAKQIVFVDVFCTTKNYARVIGCYSDIERN